MRIITVIPLVKGLPTSHLSYFTKEEVLPGSIVGVTIKNRELPALVTESRPAAELKAEARALDFSLKKMVKVIQPSFFRPEFMAAALLTARFFNAPIGAIIRSFSPKAILETTTFTKKSGKTKVEIKPKPKLKPEIVALQEPDEERLAYYKSLIRETFARQASVFFCLPTIAEIERVVTSLEKGIGAYTIILHSRLSQKEQLESWQKALTSEHPVLIVATPTFFSLPRSDMTVIIMERENSSHYKDTNRPFADARIFAAELARASGAKLVLGDIALRTETVLRLERGDFSPASNLKYRTATAAKQELINTKETLDQDTGRKKSLEIISPRLELALKQASSAGEKFFILVGRRGLAPTTICNDCGETLSCERCGAPVVLHGGEKEHYFRCHRCSQIQSVTDKCPKCGSWRLAVLGLGIDGLETEIKKRLPSASVYRLDSDTVKNPSKAKKIAESFLKTPGAVILGTEMALDYLNEPVENTAVAALDSLFTLPDFRISEKILTLVLRTRALATKKFFIQTRRPEEKVFNYALSGNLLDFYREEIAERQKLNYPPFSVLIKITRDLKNSEVNAEFKQLAEDLIAYKPTVYDTVSDKGVKQLALLIKQEEKSWPNDLLLERLSVLSPAYTIIVDPESLL